jgi:hypothetical protein
MRNFLELLQDDNYYVDAMEAISSWTSYDLGQVEEILTQPQNIEAIATMLKTQVNFEKLD